MNTQFNLLPDVKLDFIKAQRTRRLVLTTSILVSGASILLLVILLSVSGLQKKHLNDLTADIAADGKELQSQPQINKVLSVQNQLESLTALHDAKPAASRLFDYLNQVTPAQASVTNATVDFTQQTVTIDGTTDALSSVNKFVDTLKLTTYTAEGSSDKIKAFSNVTLASFSLSTSTGDTSQPATYSITLNFDKAIFDITQDVKLTIPELITTRSDQDKPGDLFKAIPKPATGGSN